MPLRFLAASLLLTSAVFFIPALASAVPIHVHKTVPVTHERIVGTSVDGPITKRWTSEREVVRVVHVAPADPDDNGVPGTQPVPKPEPVVTEDAAPTYAATEPSYSGGVGGSTVQCESGGDYAANTGNGYYGGYQFDSGTWDAYGDPAYGEANEAPPSVQDAAAASVPYDAWPNC